MKKVFRPFWSYRIEQTESWLEGQASEGNRLVALNKWTRVFTFEQQEATSRTFRLTRNKKTNLGLARLEDNGWTADVKEREWTILSSENPTIYPVRDELLSRTQRHLYVWIQLILFQLFTTVPFFLIGFLVLDIDSLIPLLTVAIELVLFLASLQLLRKHLAFQKREMGVEVDSEISTTQKKHYRVRLGWMYNLPVLEEWLEQKAAQGLILDKVTPFYFRFIEQPPQLRSFQCTFEYKVKTSFFSMYKEMGWTLHFSSKLNFLHYAIWSMPYELQEEKPKISYVKEERLKNLNRAFRVHISIAVYLVVLLAFSFYSNIISADAFFEWSFSGVLRSLLLVMGISWIVFSGNIIKNYFIQKQRLAED
ncbi:hypothetical protein CF394_14625 [Tetzosporium hominis]|uniref:DUF2812 domain-containing protein n=1 Tax=Tetzosporium hominis TaxID=2020506 RepID=A0A264W008_9BACL|nr:DUF2812 domain-containing protein [Tetzosporium hominis]OZS76920.1 hypothetical protein CF394_14625 [Tetzosporium hominis]